MEEPEDGEEMEFPYLKADHPLLAKVQAAFTEQLTAQHEKLDAQNREKSDELQKLVKHREDVGVTLYGAQQQLAKIQLQLEQYHDGLANISNQRAEKDVQLRDVTGDYEKCKQDVGEALRQLNRAQDELNQLNITLRQVEDYNTQMQAEIQVTRRATYKAEDSIKTIEKTKHKQDVLIDAMNERVKAASEEKALLQAQLIAQRQEMDAARQTLRDAEAEMAVIAFEKNQLVQQWRSSLIGMQRRDEALRNVQNAIQEQEEQEMNIDNEIRGLLASIRKEHEKHEQISAMADRNKSEMQYHQGQMTHIRAEREKLAEQYIMLKKSLDHTQKQSRNLALNTQDDQLTLKNIETQIQKVARETTLLGSAIADEISSRTTVERCEANSYKDISKIAQAMAAKENDLLNLRNEISRVKVDSLNTKSHNQMLTDRLREVQQDLVDKENLIEQFEQEIRKRHHQIEKKQLHVDRLNREYDEKRVKLEADAGSAAAIAGPLEGKIKYLRRCNQEKIKENQELQKAWIGKQTELMQLAADTERIKQQSTEIKNEKIILDQKQFRLNNQLDQEKKEIDNINLSVKRLRFEMDRWNSSLAKNELKIGELENSNKMVEKEFVAKLKEIEEGCSKMESNIAILREEKAAMQEDIVEAERQVMLWERKIHLEKEIHEALDPSVGQVETQCMKKEIHRMELRRDQLKRRQEQMILEMERSIHKRDAITLRYEPKKQKLGTSTVSLKRQLESTKKNLQMCRGAAEQCDGDIRQLEEEMGKVQVAIGDAVQETQRLDDLKYELQQSIMVNDLRLCAKETKLERVQAMAKAYESMEGPKMSTESLQADLEEERRKRTEQVDLIRVLYEAFPQEILQEDLWNSFYDGLQAG